MSKIRVLPENLANQIAAGEVVERPASVVKEFVENAIDAGACKISIQIEGDGSRLIRVVDDGFGMEEDDILLCLERHATSKLHAIEELGEIATLGFRGEAIPSIASVARLSIVSKTKDAALGNKCEIRFGKIIKVHEMGCAAGTIMEVKDLFANLPARRKFLKSKKTEISHIDDVIRNYALVNPKIGFNYQLEGRTILDLSVDSTLEVRVKTIAFRNSNEPLLRLSEAGGDKNEILLDGYLAAPGLAGGGAGLHIFVNGRVVKDRGITHAVSEGLQGFLLKGRRATGVVFLSLPTTMVDVNVHPTKQEVRFQKAGLINGIVRNAVISALKSYQDIRRSEVFGVQKNELPPEITIDQGTTFYEEPPPPEPLLTRETDYHQIVAEPVLVEPVVNYTEESHPDAKKERPVEPLVADNNILSEKASLPHYLGQVFATYILCQMDDSFIVVDQHAAQERLIFEELRQHYSRKAIPRQALLFPDVLDLNSEEREVVEQYSVEIFQLGIELKEFGGESFVITAVPASLVHLAPAEVLRGIISQFISGAEGLGQATRMENVLAGMACQASVKAGNCLQPQEAEALLHKMWRAGVFSHCPHGRPVARVFSKDEVQKWFLRT